MVREDALKDESSDVHARRCEWPTSFGAEKSRVDRMGSRERVSKLGTRS
jgi:hypothetical protein